MRTRVQLGPTGSSPSLFSDSIEPPGSRLACAPMNPGNLHHMPPIEIPLIWAKRTQKDWCKLFELDLALVRTYGVYVLWHGGQPSRVVRIGHGDIATELKACCNDRRVIVYLADGPLFVTWAGAVASDAAGIHLHLAEMLHPLIEDRAASNVVAIAARSPF